MMVHPQSVAERPTSPPPEKPVQELRTANFRDGFFTILVQEDSVIYQKNWPIRRGTPYASLEGADSGVITEFANRPLYFAKAIRPGNSGQSDFGSTDLWSVWIFLSDELAEDTYNADIDYPGESTAVSRYIRTSHTKRQLYEATPSIAYGSILTGLLSVAITAPGVNYTQASATIATGATAEAVCFGGAIIDWIVTNQGTGVTSGAALTITGDGTGATATARIQPATAVLTHQEKKELPNDSPHSHDWVQIIRVYEILPGPWLPFTRWDDRFGPIQGRRRAVVNTGQVASLTQTLKKTYEARDGSSYVSWEIEEAYSNGSGSAGNPIYPILTSSEYGPQWKAIIGRSEQLTASTSNVAFISEAAGTVTKVFYLKVDEFHELRVTETWQIPDQDCEYWDLVSLPNLIFDVDPVVFCNDTPFFTVVLNYLMAGGMTCLRKHRRTVTYSFTTTPDPDLSTSSFEPANLRYAGKMISFSFANALNDALAFSGTICHSTEMDACCWDEEWDFAASEPSATTFAAGAWYVKDHVVELIDNNVPTWRTTLIEYYSAAGEP